MISNQTKACDVLLIGYEEVENLGLRSIAAFLRQNGYKTEIQPYSPLLKENILLAIQRTNPQLVGFSLIFQRMLFDFAELVAYLRRFGVNAHFAMGGHFPSSEPEQTLGVIPGLDTVVRGEGEETMLELLESLNRRESWRDVKGLAFRRNSQIVLTDARPLIQDLDALPNPVRDGRKIIHRGIGICSIISSRGCYHNCSFCSIRQFYSQSKGPKRRCRSPSHVVEEMEGLFHKHGVRIFVFEDDDFVMKGRTHRQWVERFLLELRQRRLANEIIWRISCRVDDVDNGLLSKMMGAGLISVYLGIESGNSQGLKIYNKKYSVNHIIETISGLRDLGMPFEFGFMLFNPESNFETLKKDIDFLKMIGDQGDAIIHFTKMVPYAGTPIYRRLKNEGRIKGTVASPDYDYKDPRLSLLQLLFTQAFHFRNFENNGLVERLRHAKFDSIVMSKFFQNEADASIYRGGVNALIRQSNMQCLETMSLASSFMEERTEEEIVDNWQYLAFLVEQERHMQFRITDALDMMMGRSLER